jgi:hypothetical protein
LLTTVELFRQIIPIVQFKDIVAGTVPKETREGLRRTGVVVIRGVMPKGETEALLSDARDYLGSHKFKGFPSEGEKKVVYETYWSKSQVKVCRSS